MTSNVDLRREEKRRVIQQKMADYERVDNCTHNKSNNSTKFHVHNYLVWLTITED